MNPAELDLRKKSRVAAFWYLIMTVTGPFILLYIPSRFIVSGDATTTIAKIAASPTLFRFGIVVSFLSAISFLLTGIALYAMFKTVDKGQARIMVALVVACVPLAFVATLFQIVALKLADGPGYLNSFTPAQIQSLAMFFLNLHRQGNVIAEIFWGLWLLPLGILIIKSGFFPKILGVFEVIACIGYVGGFSVGFLFPGIQGKISLITTIMILGELPFILWLIFRGARLKPPATSAAAEA